MLLTEFNNLYLFSRNQKFIGAKIIETRWYIWRNEKIYEEITQS